ncbi:transposase [Armatimonas sp.]|uniref:helix-turn-helix domain-containing protein n=1 Tax=Armatimonas sp. TaxID=1872638 RepID=UPI0037502EA6
MITTSGLTKVGGMVSSGSLARKISDSASDWREGRRLRALELYRQGWKQKHIAEALGVTCGAVSQWVKRIREAPDESAVEVLRRRKPTGAPSHLTVIQRQELSLLLSRGACSWGYSDDIWTYRRVADVIERAYGVRYHESYVGRLLRACGIEVRHTSQVQLQTDRRELN